MTEPLVVYIQDHLAGARFAVSLLRELSEQKLDTEVAHFAARLLPEIEADRLDLEEFAKQIGGDSSPLKEAAAWVAQKASQFKLDLTDAMGVFEAIEMLSLGVLGKMALWHALQSASAIDSRLKSLDLHELVRRAKTQHRELESLRLKVAMTVFKHGCG